jgi:hypothetical protein
MSAATDLGIGYAEAAGAAVWGGARGAGMAARRVWIEDRPRRQFLRANRRRLWWTRGGRWRLLVSLEIIGVGAWMIGRQSWRITRATPRGAWDGAGQGWHEARTRRAGDYPDTGQAWATSPQWAPGAGSKGPAWTAPARPEPEPGPDPVIQVTVDDLPRQARPASAAAPGPAGPIQTEIVVDADVVDPDGRPITPTGPQRASRSAGTGRAGTDPAWTRGPAWTPEVLLEMADLEAAADEAERRSQEADRGPQPMSGPACNWLEADGSFCGEGLPAGEVFCAHHGQPTPTTTSARPTRRPDRTPETESDTRMFDLREAGYAGWINQDGHAVDAEGRRLNDAELADWIASGRRGDWHVAATETAGGRLADWSSAATDVAALGTPVHPRLAQLPDGAFWLDQLQDRDNAVVVDGHHYRILPDLPDGQSGAGFDGHEFGIRYLGDGREVVTQNLWTQGMVPEAFRALLPDTAVFVPARTPQNAGDGQPVALLPVAGSTIATAQEESMSMPAFASAAASGSVSTSLGGELTGPADLLAETSHVQSLAERAAVVKDQLESWAAGLPDLVTGAPWGTGAVASAADGIAQAQGTDNLRETITGLHGALDQADELGESLGSIGATGSVEALANGQ